MGVKDDFVKPRFSHQWLCASLLLPMPFILSDMIEHSLRALIRGKPKIFGVSNPSLRTRLLVSKDIDIIQKILLNA